MAISGTAAMFSRLTNVRNVAKSIGNMTVIAPSFSRSLSLATRSYSVDINSVIDTGDDETKPKKKMSKAMKAYLERAKEYDDFIKKEITEYQIGKRHLANMMGEDPDSFDQNDVNRSIQYLFPSGLYDKRARPIMEEPHKIFPPRKAAQFDETGRPHHFLFYTCKPHYHQALHDIVDQLHNLSDFEDKELKKGVIPRADDKINLLGSEWMPKANLETYLLESLHDYEYEKFLAAIERLAEHPYAFRSKDFLMKFRIPKLQQAATVSVPELKYTSAGRPYITVKDCRRKTASADVTVLGNGSGKITINGQDISYFYKIQSREQVIFPLIFAEMENQVDVEATVHGGGTTSQAGAIRWGIAWGLRSFVDTDMIEKMRIAGLLTRDIRRRERKKPGQEGARRKFTWKKR